MKKTSLKITLPFVVSAYDYHDAGHIVDKLNLMTTGKTIRAYELGERFFKDFDQVRGYFHVIYVGKRPTRNEIKKMLDKESEIIDLR